MCYSVHLQELKTFFFIMPSLTLRKSASTPASTIVPPLYFQLFGMSACNHDNGGVHRLLNAVIGLPGCQSEWRTVNVDKLTKKLD